MSAKVTRRAMTLVAASAILAACSQPNATVPTAGSETAAGTSRVSLTEEEVRKDLTDEGYSEILDLRPQPDGSWTAIAVLAGTQRPVLVTANGFVFPR